MADSLAALLRSYPALGLEILAGESSDSAAVVSTLELLRAWGPIGDRLVVRPAPGDAIRLRLRGLD